MTGQRVWLLAFALFSCAPNQVPTRVVHQPGYDRSVPTGQELELHQVLGAWWAAAFQRDSSFFEQLLTEDFLWRRADHMNYDWSREDFFKYFPMGWACAPELDYMVRLEDIHRVGDQAWVQTTGTIWFGEPVQGRGEMELSFVFRRINEQWRLAEFRWVGYQLPSMAWGRPDTTLLPAEATRPFNPVRPASRIQAPCVEEGRLWR